MSWLKSQAMLNAYEESQNWQVLLLRGSLLSLDSLLDFAEFRLCPVLDIFFWENLGGTEHSICSPEEHAQLP